MLKRVTLNNFKSQENTTIDIAKFNVLTGYNAAGKTTMLQALVFLKQSLSRKEVTFNDYLLRLGDFRETIFRHDDKSSFSIEVAVDHDGIELGYKVTVSQWTTREEFKVDGEATWMWDSGNSHTMEPSGRLFLPQAAGGYGGGTFLLEDAGKMMQAVEHMSFMMEWFDNMLYLSSSRGFTKYAYPLLAGQPEPEEVAKRAGDASLLEEWLSNLIMYRINEAQRYPAMRGQLDVMRERLSRVGVDINPYVMNGPSVVIDLAEGDMWVSAVNSGYGINQLVSFVALGTLLPEGTVVMIEEPEIHLHPKMQRIICEILAEIADEGKQVIITTHSEHFLRTLGKRINEGKLEESDLRAYHFEKIDRKACGRTISVTDEKEIENLF